MAELKFTKTELRDQQVRLQQLTKYLPTLQLKKAMLQMEINQVLQELDKLQIEFDRAYGLVEKFVPLLEDSFAGDLWSSVEITRLEKTVENVAGIDLPTLDRVEFVPPTFHLLESPPWIDTALVQLRELLELREKIKVELEKKRVLEVELREVSIRVNLFERILIPRAQENIKKIRIFLGDLQLSEVARAKVSKQKIQSHKQAEEEMV